MNFAKFFVDRPIFAAVLSLLILMAGAICLPLLPISEYPEVAPPSVVVRAQYPGANPKVIAATVATPLEEQINGVENMLYMSSQSTADGQMGLTVTFKLGTDPDLAQQLVQNRVSQALPRLPDIVRQIGITTAKSSSNITLVVHLTSPDGRYDTTYLRNFGTLNIRDRLARLKGAGEVLMFGGGDYAMRIWLDPGKIAALGLTASDVVNSIREQNVQVAGGVVGGQPHDTPAAFELLVNAQGRLQSEEEFGNIILKSSPTGGITRLKDVARIELGANQYAMRSLLDNKEAAAVAVFQAPESNAIQLSNDARAVMAELKKTFPEGIDYTIVYDPTRFVQASIDSVIKTLLEAIALVVIVVIVFLQTWRASIIPLLAVPVSVIGTFAVMHLFGFSINNLTLFGLVLSIGIVVDDAIVVVENVERNIEEGLEPLAAAHKAMEEVSSPIIAIALTLCAVFIPLAFISGLTGQFYRQFALTIAISTVISAFNSLTLSPALAAKLLMPHNAEGDKFERLLASLFGWFFRGFNAGFRYFTRGYTKALGFVMRGKTITVLFYLALAACAGFLFYTIPRGYIPQQDKQYLVAFAQLPSGSSLERTDSVIRRISDIAMAEPGVAHAVAFPGLSIAGFSASSSAGLIFITLKPFEERTTDDLYGDAIAGRLMGKVMGIEDAFSAVVNPPPVMGLGTIGGFKIQVEDRSDLGYEALQKVIMAAQMQAWQKPQVLSQVFSTYQINVPQLFVDVDRTKAKQLGVPLTDIFNTMQVYLGSLYINDFNRFGRTYQVIAQADAPFRAQANDILQLKTRNMAGEMVPLGSVVNVKQSYGPDSASRYNLYRTADINAGPAPGVPAEVAEAEMVKILKELMPPGMDFEWTDLKYQQILAGDTARYIFPLCVLLVFLVLAAQYESLLLPLVVIMIVPIVMLFGILGVFVTGGDNNIFTQIGLIVLVGLACKNAILIVEFARELEFQGKSIIDAALTASRLRIRPILMTSFAFIMGVLPLVSSTGAGAEMRHAIGITVFSGMLGVTLLGIFFTPLFYVILRTLAGKKLTGHHHVGEITCPTEAGK